MISSSTFVVNLPEQFSGKSVLAAKKDLHSKLHCDAPRIILDLSQVREMDSAGLELLLDCMIAASKKNGSVSLADVSPEAATYLELARMDRAFAMFPSIGDAVHSGDEAYAPTEVVADVAQLPQPAVA